MKRLLKNASVVNVFTDTLDRANVLLDGDTIVGVGEYTDADADLSEDLTGKFLCPGFIDGHVHIESSMLRPVEFARACLPHGTVAIVADPHEIVNVSGMIGMQYMLEASEGLPMHVFFVTPSCVPATPLDEAGAELTAEDIARTYQSPRVLGLGEMMDYPAVVAGDPDTMRKLEVTKKAGLLINGHAPMITGRALDRYIAAGIYDDHECSSFPEALERLRKGQWIMIRQGTAARNLEALMGLFAEPYSRRCLLVTDDKHPADLLHSGHIDSILRLAVEKGASPFTAIRMATLQAAQRFGLNRLGAVAPGFEASLLVLDDLTRFTVRDVYFKGEPVVQAGYVPHFSSPHALPYVWRAVRSSFFLSPLRPAQFEVEPAGKECRVIRVLPDQLITEEARLSLDFTRANGVDTERDILKLAVVERHMDTGHVGLGYIQGLGMKRGAIASSVSHDSHNLILAGCTAEDMALAGNCVREMGGGLAVVCGGHVIASLPLPVGGLMSLESAAETARRNEEVRRAVYTLGVAEGIEPFMNLAFVSLSVIPQLKMTTFGLVDVDAQKLVPLFFEE